ncbi:hypothetical protein MP638_005225 [Amoeboaphelidium occidentale]|nr:hypothetical protein MP638_005225 [Amoeboaphelidium occidentale]
MSSAASALKNVNELRIHFCQTSSSSQGVRDFITKNYMALKKANPKLPILLREASGISARCYARYDYGKEKKVTLDNLSANEVMTRLQALDLEGSENTGKQSFAA